jgi:hypothetical protein
MTQGQVSLHPVNSHDMKIKSAIYMLLSSESVEVSEPTVQLTECSPDVEVVINKQGGICTRCNSMFKSRSSLLNHIKHCFKQEIEYLDQESEEEYNLNTQEKVIKLSTNRPRLVIVPH